MEIFWKRLWAKGIVKHDVLYQHRSIINGMENSRYADTRKTTQQEEQSPKYSEVDKTWEQSTKQSIATNNGKKRSEPILAASNTFPRKRERDDTDYTQMKKQAIYTSTIRPSR